jgi:ribose 5-phosphate isomerase A
MNNNTIDSAKKAAAMLAVEENVKKDMILGIGSGSTIIYVVEKISDFLNIKKSSIICIPTSYQSQELIIKNGLTIGTLDQYPDINLAIDGADEIDSELNLIKGGGGCLVQERIVAASAQKLVIVADWTKKSSVLGEKWLKGVPIEIIPQAQRFLNKKFRELGGQPKLRQSNAKLGPLITDNGNFIIDVNFGKITSPKELHSQLVELPGVVDTGIFVNMTSKAYIGQVDKKVEIFQKS